MKMAVATIKLHWLKQWLYCGSNVNLLEDTQNFQGDSRNGIFTDLYCSNVDNSKSSIIQSEMLAQSLFYYTSWRKLIPVHTYIFVNIAQRYLTFQFIFDTRNNRS